MGALNKVTGRNLSQNTVVVIYPILVFNAVPTNKLGDRLAMLGKLKELELNNHEVEKRNVNLLFLCDAFFRGAFMFTNGS